MTARVRQVSGTGIAVLFTDLALIVDNTSACTIQLPDPATWYYPLVIRTLTDPATAAHRVTLLRHGSETIGGAAGNVFLASQPSTIIWSDFTNWQFAAGMERPLFSSGISPTQISSNQNDYSPTDWASSQVVRLTSDAARTITGCSGPGSLPKLLLNTNTDASRVITISHDSASSTAANRIYCPGGVDFKLGIESLGFSAWMFYDATAGRWVLHSAPSTSNYFPAITPSQITTNQNNYAPTGWDAAQRVYLGSSGTVLITGFAASNTPKLLIPDGVNLIGLVHESASSTAANRIHLPSYSASPLSVSAPTAYGLLDCPVLLIYNNTTSRWNMFGTVDQAVMAAAQAYAVARAGDQMAGNLGLLGVALDRTLTTTGTTGAQTINHYAGTVNFAASATTLVVTSSVCQSDSLVYAQVLTADTTMKSCSTQAANGSFTITANAAATAETKVAFWITH